MKEVVQNGGYRIVCIELQKDFFPEKTKQQQQQQQKQHQSIARDPESREDLNI